METITAQWNEQVAIISLMETPLYPSQEQPMAQPMHRRRPIDRGEGAVTPVQPEGDGSLYEYSGEQMASSAQPLEQPRMPRTPTIDDNSDICPRATA